MFITIEGPEGSGKTTAVDYAVNKLLEMNYQIVRTREPGGTPIAEQIRNVILDKSNIAMDKRTEALLLCCFLEDNISLRRFGQH